MTTGNDDGASCSSSSSDSDGSDSERELGRHEYWESTYELELATLRETGDEGEVWFGGKVEETVAAFCAQLLLLQTPPTTTTSEPSSEAPPSPPSAPRPQPRLLDVGCGNGALLLALAGRGFSDLTGSDYSEKALALARAVVDKRRGEEKAAAESGTSNNGGGGDNRPLSRASFSFVHDDATRSLIPPGSFDAATDKGTLDAVGLSAGGAAARRAYLLGVARCLKKNGGLLIVTSVNSTLEELRAEVEALREEDEGEGEEEEKEKSDGRERATAAAAAAAAEKKEDKGPPSLSPPPPLFEYLDHVKTYPVYSFGGRTGARVATVAFRKR